MKTRSRLRYAPDSASALGEIRTHICNLQGQPKGSSTSQNPSHSVTQLPVTHAHLCSRCAHGASVKAMTDPTDTGYFYVLALLDPNGNPRTYLTQIVDQSYGPWGYRLDPDLSLAWTFPDRRGAQEKADELNSTPANTP